VFADLEVEIDANLALKRFSEPEVTVCAVWSNEIDLLTAVDPIVKAIGEQIAKAAPDNQKFIQELFEQEVVLYRGLGGNDPDGHYVRTRPFQLNRR
tara:strand:+ start:375 stop:662 length:288 start_codon:yes stop_codon:yes gene_type:complete